MNLATIQAIRAHVSEDQYRALMRTTVHPPKTLFGYAERLFGPLMRISLGVVLVWIGCIHLVDPQPVVNLLSMSLPLLAFSAFVYLLGGLEASAGILLLAGYWIRYVALLSLPLFALTLTIFVIAPGVTGFPLLTLTGQFILKDTVLASAAITLIARDAASHVARLADGVGPSSSSRDAGVTRRAA